MSAPLLYTLSLYRGDSYRWRFVLWTDATHTQPVDLTGVVAAATIRQTSGDTVLACAMTANEVAVTLAAADSQLLAPTAGSWDLQLTYPTADVKTIVSGSVMVRADVTGS